jgi:P27 family predicted phage terminase small subunit
MRPNRRTTAYGLAGMDDKSKRPPDHLRPATKAWWARIVADFTFEAHQLHGLQATAEAWDIKERACEALADSGLTYTDDKGSVRARPEVNIERDARTAYMRGMRELNLVSQSPVTQRPWD